MVIGVFSAATVSNLKVSVWNKKNGLSNDQSAKINHRVNMRIMSGDAQITLCRSFFADVPDHSRPPRSVMIVTKQSDRGLNSRSLSAQDCKYALSTTAVRHWYDGSVWSALSTFSTTISTTTDTIDTTALTMLTTTPTLLPICYHDWNNLTD